jgi:hypothetical protein
MRLSWCWASIAVVVSACATTPEPAPPPRLQMAAMAAEPCALYRLPSSPTLSDLETGFATRGAELVDCDGRRRLAVETAKAEHDLQDRWLAPQGKRGWRLFSRGKSADAAASHP